MARGIYVDQLKVWSSLFPKEQILIIKSEDIYTNPSPTFKRVLNFLDLPEWEPKNYKNFNAASYSKIEHRTRKKLIDYFEPHNQRLYEYLDTNFGW
ncbi:sulfotransferase domain-containing protein [Nostoc sp.]|uniref:sulfotransferase domain-containing protein n=1 Tax=Nostoc sp. TaxID=1180 RepID=UPI003593D3B8